MKLFCLIAAVIVAVAICEGQAPSKKPAMVMPTVTHKTEKVQQEYDHVTVTCPDGYEGHFVDRDAGFDFGVSPLAFYGDSGAPGFTICFEKSFMDEVRKHPEMLRARPVVHPV